MISSMNHSFQIQDCSSSKYTSIPKYMQSVISFSSFFSLCCRTLMNIKSLYSYLILFITANILIVILISQIVKSFFLINQFLKMEDNYFTILWWFLPYINMNQPWVYVLTLMKILLFFTLLSICII